MVDVKVTFGDGDHLTTGFNGSLTDAENYYLNRYFNLGCVEDNMQKAVRVEKI